MATNISVDPAVSAPFPPAKEPATTGEATSVPWYIWCSVIAVTSVMLGGYWDISWHMSIGRDTFWTPPHMAIYFCGVLAGISCGYLILSTTFARSARFVRRGLSRQSDWAHKAAATSGQDASVKIWGFRAPLGAFISAWGGIVMLASAAFDNWWHNAYGLDVKIFSPPHVALDTGILAVQVGGLVLIVGAMNRAQGELKEKLNWLFLYLGAMIVTLGLAAVWEYTYRVFMHSTRCYRAVALLVPVLLVGVARASGRRWAATIVMGIYSVYSLLLLWIFPLFPAEPKLGPVYQRVTHLVPMEFPLLLIVPAFVLDYWLRMPGSGKWLQTAGAGSAFLLTFVAVQWPFASFLMSPASHNWFFGTHYFPYFESPNSYAVRNLFFPWDRTPAEFWLGAAGALGFAVLSTRLGLAWGDWMRRVRR